MIQRLFQDISDLVRLKRSYRAVFKTPEGQVVLRDLAKVCYAAQTTFDAEPHEQARREGARQVWLSIQSMLNIPDDEVFHYAKGEN